MSPISHSYSAQIGFVVAARGSWRARRRCARRARESVVGDRRRARALRAVEPALEGRAGHVGVEGEGRARGLGRPRPGRTGSSSTGGGCDGPLVARAGVASKLPAASTRAHEQLVRRRGSGRRTARARCSELNGRAVQRALEGQQRRRGVRLSVPVNSKVATRVGRRGRRAGRDRRVGPRRVGPELDGPLVARRRLLDDRSSALVAADLELVAAVAHDPRRRAASVQGTKSAPSSEHSKVDAGLVGGEGEDRALVRARRGDRARR